MVKRLQEVCSGALLSHGQDALEANQQRTFQFDLLCMNEHTGMRLIEHQWL